MLKFVLSCILVGLSATVFAAEPAKLIRKPVQYYSDKVVHTTVNGTSTYEVLWYTTFPTIPPVYGTLEQVHTKLVTPTVTDCMSRTSCDVLKLGDIGFGVYIRKLYYISSVSNTK